MALRGTRTGIALILFGAIMFGFLPTAAKFAYADGANALFVMLCRAMIGVLVMLGFLWLTGKTILLNPALLKNSWATGIAHTLSVFGILASIVYIDISLASIILFMYPVPVAVVSHLKGDTPLTPLILALILFALIGLSLVLGVSLHDLNLRGLVIAFIGMFAFATMVLMMTGLTKQVGAVTANLAMTSWAAIIFVLVALAAPFLPLIAPIETPASTSGWLFVAIVGLTFSIGYLCFFAGAGIIGASRASLLSISEPVLMILFAVALLGESLTPLQWLGVGIVITSLCLSEIGRRESQTH